ncbi:MAG: hypothetical protein QHJ73_17125, partial [Armatimonadota bacterium]|nr:hypothetical protein [Armatimonadota bacterium]
ENPGRVVRGIAGKVRENTRSLLGCVGPLVFLLLLPPLTGCRREKSTPVGPPDARAREWILLAAANFLAASGSWVAAGSARYVLPSVVLLLPLLTAAGLAGARRSVTIRLLFALVLAAALVHCGRQDLAHYARCQRGWEPTAWQRYRIGAQWVGQAEGDDTSVVASNYPWMVHYLTGRPAVACPYFPRGTDAATFARRFGVRWFLLFTGEKDARTRHCQAHPALQQVRANVRQRIYLFTWRQKGEEAGGRGGTLATQGR